MCEGRLAIYAGMYGGIVCNAGGLLDNNSMLCGEITYSYWA